MWCPRCKSEYRDGIEVCPVCQVALTEDEPLDEASAEGGPSPLAAMDPEFLMTFQDQKELGMAKEILTRAEIPFLCREPGSGEYLRIVTGANFYGTELYVEKGFTHRALRLLQQFDHEAGEPFADEALDEAIEAYEAENPGEAEPENDGAPASPEGYRMVWAFLAIFGILAVLAILAVTGRR